MTLHSKQTSPVWNETGFWWRNFGSRPHAAAFGGLDLFVVAFCSSHVKFCAFNCSTATGDVRTRHAGPAAASPWHLPLPANSSYKRAINSCFCSSSTTTIFNSFNQHSKPLQTPSPPTQTIIMVSTHLIGSQWFAIERTTPLAITPSISSESGC